MRFALPVLMSMVSCLPVSAGEVAVTVHSERPFGYFVGDLIRAHVDVSGPASSELSAASLPRPGPLGVSLDLRDIAVQKIEESDKKSWRIDLVYQNFYVALDVRNLQIPGFDLRVGGETVSVPAWSVSVTPLREIAPARLERAEDYLRPDTPAVFVNEARSRDLALAAATAALLSLGVLAFDRGWPPFQRRRARVFSALAVRLAAQARASHDAASFTRALRSVHRAIDAANGASLTAEDLSGFLARRTEFAPLRPSFDRFFAISSMTFFSDGAALDHGYDLSELLRFVDALARRERAR